MACRARDLGCTEGRLDLLLDPRELTFGIDFGEGENEKAGVLLSPKRFSLLIGEDAV